MVMIVDDAYDISEHGVRQQMTRMGFHDNHVWPVMWALPLANRDAIMAWLSTTLCWNKFVRWQGWVLFKCEQDARMAHMVWAS
jgi:hypothetical protein